MMVLVVPSFCLGPDSFLPLFSSWGSQASMPVFWCEASLPLSKKVVGLPSLKGLPFPLYMPHRVWHNLRPKAGWSYSMRGHSCLLRLPTCWTRAVFLLACLALPAASACPFIAGLSPATLVLALNLSCCSPSRPQCGLGEMSDAKNS